MNNKPYLKPYMLSLLDTEIIKMTKNNQSQIKNDIFLMILLSHDYPFIPLTVIFEDKHKLSEIDSCIFKLIENKEIILLSKHDNIDDFLHEEQSIFTSSSNFSSLFNEDFSKYIFDINPIINSQPLSMTKFLYDEMMKEQFQPIAYKLKQSKKYNSPILVAETTSELMKILDNRKSPAIIEETFLPILNYTKIDEQARKYVFKKTISYNNNLYYRQYCEKYNAIIPIGLESLSNTNSTLEEMNYYKDEYKSSANNLFFWRRIIEGLQLSTDNLNCETIIKLRKNPNWNIVKNKIKDLLEFHIYYYKIFDTQSIDIFNILKFPSPLLFLPIEENIFIERMEMLIESNSELMNENQNNKGTQMGMTVHGNVTVEGDILNDNAVKNDLSNKITEKIQILINDIQKSEEINNKSEVIENIQKYSNDNSKLKDYLNQIGSISSIGSALVGLLALL